LAKLELDVAVIRILQRDLLEDRYRTRQIASLLEDEAGEILGFRPGRIDLQRVAKVDRRFRQIAALIERLAVLQILRFALLRRIASGKQQRRIGPTSV